MIGRGTLENLRAELTSLRHSQASGASVTDAGMKAPSSPHHFLNWFKIREERRLIQRQPTATLKELCQVIQTGLGIILSPQTFCKLLLRIGLTRMVRHQFRTNAISPEQPMVA